MKHNHVPGCHRPSSRLLFSWAFKRFNFLAVPKSGPKLPVYRRMNSIALSLLELPRCFAQRAELVNLALAKGIPQRPQQRSPSQSRRRQSFGNKSNWKLFWFCAQCTYAFRKCQRSHLLTANFYGSFMEIGQKQGSNRKCNWRIIITWKQCKGLLFVS